MAFIPTNPGAGGPKKPSKKKKSDEYQEFVVEREAEEIDKWRQEAEAAKAALEEHKQEAARLEAEREKEFAAKYQKAMDELRTKARQMDDAWKLRSKQLEDEYIQRSLKYEGKVREQRDAKTAEAQDEVEAARRKIESARKELQDQEKQLARERLKIDLALKQKDAGSEKLRLLEDALERERKQAKEAARKSQQKILSQEEALRRERERAEEKVRTSEIEAGRMIDEQDQNIERERKRADDALQKLKEAEERMRRLEDELELPPAERKAPPPGRTSAAPDSDAPPAPTMPPGRKTRAGKSPVQKRVDELMIAKAKDGSLLGDWSGKKKPPEDPNLVIKVVQAIMEEAARAGASDIHLESLEAFLRVRLRIDGILEEALRIPNAANLRVISRIRVMCGLDPEQGTSTAKPQEGRMVVTVDGRDVDLRLSTFPTAYGDKVVLRLIYRDQKTPDLTQLGLKPEVVEKIQALIHRPQGMIIVTGPAGSGKSTTLYSLLQVLNDPERNIITLEDPMEMKIPGINQSTVQPKIGFTFAEGLRAILRQDPNVIMVGEIRDRPTAEIAMSASLTGHLLLTTLHTNSAAGAITRLLDMGIEPYMVASAVTASLAQRLVRRICDRCRETYVPEKAVVARLKRLIHRTGIRVAAGDLKNLSRGAGCRDCRGSGYKGRVLLFEMVRLSGGLRNLIIEKASLDAIQQAAADEGFEPMLAQGVKCALAGETTLEDVFRLVGSLD